MRIALVDNRLTSVVNFRGPWVRELIGAGHEVYACAPAEFDDMPGRVTALGAIHRPYPLQRTGTSPRSDLETLGALTSLFRELRPSVVVAYSIKPCVWGGLAARRAGVPRFVGVLTGMGHTFIDSGARARVLRGIVQTLLRRGLAHADAVVVHNTDDGQLVRDHRLVPDRCPVEVTGGSGVDLEHFAATAPPPGPPTFLMVARLIREKGIYEFAEAARLVRQQHPEAVFRLVGGLDRNPSAVSEEEVRGWQAAGTLHWTGPVRDVREELARCTAYVLPSYREGCPKSVLEALSTGRAILTTDVPGCRDTVEEGVNGHLVPARDPVALARAARRLVEGHPDVPTTMGRASLERARTRFDAKQVAAVMERASGIPPTGVQVNQA